MVDQSAKTVPVRVLAVTSGKGGVGKTNISVNLAVGLARKGHKVMLMDADLGLANVDILLGIRPEFDLYHVITGSKTLDEVIIEGPHGIMIVPAASGIGRMAELTVTEHAGLIRAFSDLGTLVDYLIIDVAAGISDSVTSFSRASQDVIVAVCDEPASITDAYALIKVLNREHGVTRFQVLCNRVADGKHGRKLYATLAAVADQYLDVSLGYLGAIPEDPKLLDAVRQQVPVTSLYPYSQAGVAFRSLADTVEKLPRRNAGSGQVEFFIERVIQQNDTRESVIS